MFLVSGLIFISALTFGTSKETEYVEPEHLDMLQRTENYEELARLLKVEDVNAVKPGDKLENPHYNNVSALGDIMFTGEEARQVLRFNRYTRSKWQFGYIPYVISGDFDDNERQYLNDWINDWNSKVRNLKLYPRNNNEKDYVYVFSGNGCWSYLGKVGGQQGLSMQKNGCLYKAIIQHEFMHACGFAHEHNRPDRDYFVDVLLGNIPAEWQSQYEKVKDEDYRSDYGYDCYSIMHYGMKAPGSNNDAFNLKVNCDRNWVGQREVMTGTDRAKIDKAYE